MALLVSGGVRFSEGRDPEDFDSPHILWPVSFEEICNSLAIEVERTSERQGSTFGHVFLISRIAPTCQIETDADQDGYYTNCV
jgi:hypothetical protein